MHGAARLMSRVHGLGSPSVLRWFEFGFANPAWAVFGFEFGFANSAVECASSVRGSFRFLRELTDAGENRTGNSTRRHHSASIESGDKRRTGQEDPDA